jgi:hypothetical protein
VHERAHGQVAAHLDRAVWTAYRDRNLAAEINRGVRHVAAREAYHQNFGRSILPSFDGPVLGILLPFALFTVVAVRVN